MGLKHGRCGVLVTGRVNERGCITPSNQLFGQCEEFRRQVALTTLSAFPRSVTALCAVLDGPVSDAREDGAQTLGGVVKLTVFSHGQLGTIGSSE